MATLRPSLVGVREEFTRSWPVTLLIDERSAERKAEELLIKDTSGRAVIRCTGSVFGGDKRKCESNQPNVFRASYTIMFPSLVRLMVVVQTFRHHMDSCSLFCSAGVLY